MSRNLLLLVSGIVACILLAELALRFRYAQPPVWIEPQTKHLESPLLGWVLEPGTESFTIDAPVSINELGLRDDEIAVPKPTGETRILCLGDSFTFALGVRFEDLYTEQLERILDDRHPPARFQVVNGGVAGYNTRQELIYLLSRGLDLEPDLIVIAFYWNDLVGNDDPLPDPESTPKYAPEATFREETGTGHTLPKGFRDILRRSVLLYLLAQAKGRIEAIVDPPRDRYSPVQRALLEGDDDFLEPYWAATLDRLSEIVSIARSREIPVVLLVFPMENQILHEYPELELVQPLREMWAGTSMPLIDLEPIYREARQSEGNPFLPYDAHPNARGMRLAAEALYRAIVDHRLLDLQAPGGPG